jgi:hypothetical protein
MPDKPLQNRRQLAAKISEKYFPVTPRQLATWAGLTVRYVGREALLQSDEAMAEAKRRFEDAPVIKQGAA